MKRIRSFAMQNVLLIVLASLPCEISPSLPTVNVGHLYARFSSTAILLGIFFLVSIILSIILCDNHLDGHPSQCQNFCLNITFLVHSFYPACEESLHTKRRKFVKVYLLSIPSGSCPKWTAFATN